MSTEEKKVEAESESSSETSSDEEVTTPKKPSGLPSISIPKNFVKVPIDTVSDYLRHKESSFVVIDVRDVDFTGGNIPGCIQAPYGSAFDGKLTELVNQYASYKHVVFCCMYGQLRSPSCALGFIKKMQELRPDCTPDNVFVLSGGFHDYLVKNHSDPHLVENYNSEFWSMPEFLHIRDADVKTFRPGK